MREQSAAPEAIEASSRPAGLRLSVDVGLGSVLFRHLRHRHPFARHGLKDTCQESRVPQSVTNGLMWPMM